MHRRGKNHRRHLTAGWSPATVADVFVCDVSDELKADLGVVTSAARFRLELQGRHIREQRGKQALSLINSLQYDP